MLKNLAEIALDADLASSKALERAAVIADGRGIPLVEALITHENVDELALIRALRKQLRVPLADPADVKIESEALRSLSKDLCQRRRVMPLAISYEAGDKRLRLAMADPTDPVAIAEVEHRSGMTIVPELMTLSAIIEMVDTEYKKIVTEVMKRDKQLFGAATDSPASDIKTTKMESLPELSAPRIDPTKTVPYHRVSDEAELNVRFEALLQLLIENKVISEDAFEEQVRELLKEIG